MSGGDGGGLSAEEREELARLLWLADGYDLDADPTSRTAREMRPEYLHRADLVVAAGWVPAARVAAVEQERDEAVRHASVLLTRSLDAEARAEAAERRAEQVTAAVEGALEGLADEVRRLFHVENDPRGAGRVEGARQTVARALAAAPSQYEQAADRVGPVVEQARHDAEVAVSLWRCDHFAHDTTRCTPTKHYGKG